MKKRLLLPTLFILCFTAFNTSHAALTQDPSLHWQTLYTDHFEIHFHDGEASLAQQVGSIAEQVHAKLTQKFHWTPQARTQVVLTDRFDYANGSATPMPRNTMNLLVSPPTGNSVISDHDNWLELLITHEYTHIIHLDKASGLPAGLRKIIGRNLFLFPNLLQPPWLIEGLATYEETDKTRGIGRGQGTLFRGLMRQEVVNGIKPISQVNQPLVSWPMNTARYLYGVYFYQFLAERSGSSGGEQKIIELIEQYSNNLLPFSLNNNSKRVLGKDMTALWDEFSADLRSSFLPEIERIRQAGEVTGSALTHTGYYTRAPQISAQGDIFYLQNDMQSEPRLMVIRNGKTQPEIIADVRGSSFDLHPTAGIVGTEIDAVNNTNQFSDLYHVDPATGKKTVLTRGKRYLLASWSPDGKEIIAVHNELGQHALHRLDAHGNKLETLWQGDDNTVISSMDWSPDGKTLVMPVWRPDTLWNLESFNIQTRQWTQLTHDTAIENSPRYSSDGQSIVFSADYDGVFNIYRLKSGSSTPEKLTNVIGEATSPALYASSAGTQLVYVGLGKDGYDLFQLASVTPIIATTAVIKTTTTATATTATTPASTLPRKFAALQNTRVEPYNALPRIIPTSWFPYFLVDDIRSEIGLTTFGADPLRRHFYNALVAYDTDHQWGLGRLNYIYDRWNPTLKFSLERQILAYLDNANVLERYRNADIVSAEAVWPFFRYERQWLLHAGILSESESDKKILSSFGAAQTNNDQLAGLAVSFNSAHHYARSISPSYGRQVRLVAEDDDILDSDYSGEVYSLDWRELIDLPGQHVFSARAVLGWGTDNPRDFRLGGTLETSVPSSPQAAATALTENIFGQRRYPLHGYPQGRADLRGRHMALIEAEWRFPIALIERGFMSPPIGLHQIHGKLLYNWGESWDQNGKVPGLRRGAGIEFTAELVLGYWLPMDLRMGFAKGFDLGGEEQSYIEAQIPFL
jgi:Tol biopolymer transport system component